MAESYTEQAGTLTGRKVDHGVYARCPLANLPKPFTGVRRQVNAFRAAVEAAVVARSDQIGVYAAKRIRTASLALRQAACVERILRNGGSPGAVGSLTHEQWQGYSDRLLRYEEAADRALRDLGLDQAADSNPWAMLYRQPAFQLPAALPAGPGSPRQEIGPLK